MAKRGRKSKAELQAVARTAVVETLERPAPPDDLTDEQAEAWRGVVEPLPAEWFPPETLGLLAQYCRHLVAARRVADMVADYEKTKPSQFDIETYDRLLKMQEREGRALSSLATRMRLTQQTRYDKSRKRGTLARRPWKTEGED